MNIKQLLEIAKVKPNPALDQYFLTDDSVLDEEVSLAGLKKNDVVLEVGAGIGNLTLRLSKKASVLAVEKDYSFSHVLKGMPNTEVILADALEFLESLRQAKEKKKTFNKIVSNIPYSISQPLVLEFFRHKWEIAVIVVQKEFADKLASKERLGMMMSDIAEVKIARQISAGAFYPTAVPSSVVMLRQKKLLDDDFWNFLCSMKPNKNVSNQVRNCPKELASKKIHQLTLAQLKKLYQMQKTVKK